MQHDATKLCNTEGASCNCDASWMRASVTAARHGARSCHSPQMHLLTFSTLWSHQPGARNREAHASLRTTYQSNAGSTASPLPALHAAHPAVLVPAHTSLSVMATCGDHHCIQGSAHNSVALHCVAVWVRRAAGVCHLLCSTSACCSTCVLLACAACVLESSCSSCLKPSRSERSQPCRLQPPFLVSA
jgi:hypothetical protein